MKRLLLFSFLLIAVAVQAQNANYTALSGPYGDTPTKVISNSAGDLLSFKNGGTIYRSTDGGATWVPSNTGLIDNYIYDIYRDAVNNKIYALSNNRFYTSNDGGINWTTTSNTGFVNGRFILRGATTGYLFMLGGSNSNVVYRSTNGGVTWTTRFTIGSENLNPSDFDMSPSGYMYISTNGYGIYRANELEFSATQFSTAAGLTDLTITSLTINGTDLYALMNNGGPVKSTNNGATWTSIANSGMPTCCYYNGKIEKFTDTAPTTPVTYIYLFVGDKVWKTANGGTSWTSFASPGTSSTYMLSPYFVPSIGTVSSTTFFIGVQGLSLFKTTDGGANWIAVSEGFTGLIGRQLLFTDNNRILYAGSTSGLHISLDDGASWDFLNSGITARYVNGFLKIGSKIYGYGSGLISTPSTDGAVWTQVYGTSSPPYNFNNLTSNNGTTLFTPSTYNYTTNSNEYGFWKSINSGVAWSYQAITGLPAINNSFLGNDDFFLDAAGTSIFTKVYDVSTNLYSIYKISVTSGAATKITTLTSTSISDSYYFNGKLYVLTSDQKLHISSDGGTTWSIKTPPIGFSEIKVISDNTFYIHGGGEIYISTDAGNNWTNTGALDNKYVTDIIVSPANYSYGVTQYGPVYKSNATVIPPAAPTSLTVIGFAISRINLRWTDNATTETSFTIERSIGNNTSYDSIASVLQGNPSAVINGTYLAQGLTANTTYYFRVRAVSPAGKSAYSNEVTATTQLNCSATSVVPANRSWTGTTTNQSGIGIKTDVLVSIAPTVTQGIYTIDKLTVGAMAGVTPPAFTEPIAATFQENCGSTFIISASAVQSNGNGTWNEAAKTLTLKWQTRPNLSSRQETTVFTLNATDPIPSSPTGLSAYSNSSTSAYMSWTGSKFISEYIIQRSLTTSTGFAEIGRVPYTSLSYIDANLTTGTKYYYRIIASNTWGQSAASTEASITVQTTMFDPVQLAPAGIYAGSQGYVVGSAWVDLDGDSWEDLIFPGFGIDQPVSSYRNKGDGTFEPVTLTNLSSDLNIRFSIGTGDYDNDGKIDLLTTTGTTGKNKLWTNKGNNVFESQDIFQSTYQSYGPAFIDFNNDGLLDFGFSEQFTTAPKPYYLFQQQTDHTFSRYELGDLGNDVGNSISSSWADYDNDNDLDLLVEEYDDTRVKRLYKNNGDGTFAKQSVAAFTTDMIMYDESSSWGDFDNDGDLDLFQGNTSPDGTETLNDMLYQNNGDGTFTRLPDRAPSEILPVNPQFYFTNGSAWGDVDNDGDLDLLVIRSPNNTLYLNNGNTTFTKYAGLEALNSTQPYDNGAAFADYNKDGFLDIYIQRSRAQPTVVLRNTKIQSTNKWIEFNLVGTTSNRSAIGARVTLNLPAGKKQIRELSLSTGYSATGSHMIHFGLGATATIPSVTVRWPSGITNTFTNVAANQIVNITEDGLAPQEVSKSPVSASTGVATNTKLEITFNEPPIAVGGKKITLMTGATTIQAFNATDGVISGNKVSFTPTSALAQFTTFTISVDAGAFADNSGNATAAIAAANWTFTTVDTTVPTLAFNPTAPATLDKGFSSTQFTVTATDNSGSVSSVILSYRKISGGAFTDITLTSSPYAFTIQETFFDAMGMEFYITAKDASNNIARLPADPNTNSFTFLKYKTGANPIPSAQLGFGGGKTNWKIFAIPFDLGSNNSVTSVFDELGANDNTKWRLITYKNATAWGEFPGDFSDLTRGKGYFINIKTPVTINLPEASAPANTRANLYQLALKKGWNQIGNPYLTPIIWADAVAYNTLTGTATKLMKFNGTGYVEGTDLQPFEGGFVNADNDVTISIPFSGQTTPGGRMAQITSNLNGENWSVPLKLSQQDITNVLGGIGMNQDASISIDDFDYLNPPRFFDYTEINFAHPEHFMKNFVKDVVPTQNEYTWTFNVDSNIDGPAELNWDNTSFGDNNKELFLFDVASQMAIDMRSESSYPFYPSVSHQFRIYYGENLKDKVNPDFVALGEPYPNPSAAKTTIPFRLPGQDASYSVSLEVYDMLGKKVATLAEGNYKSGFYSSIWNTEDSNLANGVYTVRFVVGGKSSAILNKKVILKK